jgi:hypothetical protein
MRASDFLGAEVLDRSGQPVGEVHDIRLVQDGPIIGSFGAAFRVDALLAGPGSVGTRLGYDRGNVKGPLPLKAFFARIHRDIAVVPWENIAAIEPGRIRLNVARDQLPRRDQRP